MYNSLFVVQMAEGMDRPPSPWPYTERSKPQVWTAPRDDEADDAKNAFARHSNEADSSQNDGSVMSDSLSADQAEEDAVDMYGEDDQDELMLAAGGTLLPGELDVGWANAHDR
jgi:hypothetical protein